MAKPPPDDGIPCPYCGHTRSRTVASRPRSGHTYRRRECKGCGKRFSTEERALGAPVAR